ncbi:Type I phosphodiesterase / nucleotide pyrophosphatase [Lachnospiraceae bacterium NE2001]|nr:Type I phosphodiesterase / nucleotide pyrophosphatase [Lachnospiraceae bacterium NE2001]
MGKDYLNRLPDYNNCLVNLANSILKKFDVETTASTLPLADEYLKKDYKNVVVLLLDAMGISILEKHLSRDGFFRSHLAGAYDSVYPPTTVAATTSIMSGLYPNEHGWLGWDMYIPNLDKNVTIFQNIEQYTEKADAKPASVGDDGKPVWDVSSMNEAKQAADYNVAWTELPYKSIIDKINDAGGKAFFSMPFMPPHPQDLDAILSRVSELCREPGKKYIYAYWNEPDSTMHRTGTVSSETHKVVTELEKKVEEFAAGLSDTLLLITADHSHMDSNNLCILDYPEVVECLKIMPSIEPRTINLFVKDEKIEEFPEIFERNFGDDFLLLTRDEVLENKVFGPGQDRDGLGEMIGDYVAFSVSKSSIFVAHLEAQMMPGGHAGLTEEEIAIPLIAVEL